MSHEYLREELSEQEARMKAMRERQLAAMQGMRVKIEQMKASMVDMEMEHKEEILTAMQAFVIKVAARRLYHEAPDDVFELSVRLFSDVDEFGRSKGGLNVLRLVSKRCLQVVESVATRLTGEGDLQHYCYETLPVTAMKRCKRIEHIGCFAIESLEGCPDGLKSLYVVNGTFLESLEPLSACKELESVKIRSVDEISDLSPLSSCTNLMSLILTNSNVSDLSPLSSLAHLQELDLQFDGEVFHMTPSIMSIESLSQCKRLKRLNIAELQDIKDLSPLSQCPDLEDLDISELPLIKDLSFFEKGFATLRVLSIIGLPIDDFSPLAKLHNLMELDCYGMPSSTSLLPLARCYKIKRLICSSHAKDLDELRVTRPELKIN